MHTATGCLSPTQAAHIAGRGRKLLRAGRLAHRSLLVLDALLWSARPRGRDAAVVSYSRLQDLVHVCRATVAKALAELQALGLVTRVKRRVLVLWHNGGRAWRQLSNEYRFCCESAGQTESQKQETLIHRVEPSSPEIKAAQAALEERQRVIRARLASEVGGVRP